VQTLAASVITTAIVELASVVIAVGINVLFSSQRHSLIFNLGNNSTVNETINLNELFLTFTISFVAEGVVTLFSLQVAQVMDVPLSKELQQLDHPVAYLSYVGALISATFLVLHAFKATPNFITCDSADPCSCTSSSYKSLFDGICNTTDEDDADIDIDNILNESEDILGSTENISMLVMTSIIIIAFGCVGFLSVFLFVKKSEQREEKRIHKMLLANALSPEQIMMMKEIMKGDSQLRLSVGTKRMTNKIDHNDPLQRLEIKVTDVTILQRTIGAGTFGDVHKAKYKGTLIAIKQMTSITAHSMKEFRHEILLLSQMRHPNIIFMLGAIWSPALVGIVLEYAEGGALSDALKTSTVSASWTWEDPKLKIASDIAQGMNFLHSTPYYDELTQELSETVLHLDLKPGNVLLTSTLSAKVSDFGKSKVVGKRGQKIYEAKKDTTAFNEEMLTGNAGRASEASEAVRTPTGATTRHFRSTRRGNHRANCERSELFECSFSLLLVRGA